MQVGTGNLQWEMKTKKKGFGQKRERRKSISKKKKKERRKSNYFLQLTPRQSKEPKILV